MEGLAAATSCIRCSARSSSITALQCGYCTPGFLMLAAGMLERRARDQRRRDCARCSRPISAAAPATRTSSRRCAPRPRCGTGDDPAEGAISASSLTAAGGSAARHRRGRFAGDIDFPHQLHMRVVRSPSRARRGSSDRHARRAPLPGVVAVWTVADIAEICRRSISANARSRSSSPIASRCSRRNACAMSASRSRSVFADDAYRRRGRRRAGRARDRGTAAVIDAACDRPANSRPACPPRR